MCEVQASFNIALPKPKNSTTNLIFPNTSQSKRTKSVLMSFVDNLWSMEISGGSDQMQPLTVISVKKNGLARRAGIKVGDIITHINGTPANNMTLLDAQLEIQDSGKTLKLTVKGDSDESTSNSSEEDETTNTVDFWFKPMKPEELNLLEWQKKRDEKRRMTKQLYQEFPWNDRKKPLLRTSNCFMASACNREREIKLKASKERYIESERKRLMEIEGKIRGHFISEWEKTRKT
ncbi:hypothetical protein PVAND_011320 [Polypedilum vanderplanki]|uniref:PDZ domain-containing protein n=1 Tax=Polypedilum vanderplanki TaxID=319348 RepID=A0A9J6CIS2_POLVA|nr:hypothetical protein PVAND_011320 [Polypedilum vanderplanki]